MEEAEALKAKVSPSRGPARQPQPVPALPSLRRSLLSGPAPTSPFSAC